ncbi:MAG: hypothetical protein Q9N67_06835 [Ghiorsea sp.]|nr:hypothetical protein [Ghiorsea sp.]
MRTQIIIAMISYLLLKLVNKKKCFKTIPASGRYTRCGKPDEPTKHL